MCACVDAVYEFYTQRGSTALPSDFAASSASPATAAAAAPVTPTPLPTAAAAMFQHRHVVWRARFAIRLYEIMDGAEFNVVSMEKGTVHKQRGVVHCGAPPAHPSAPVVCAAPLYAAAAVADADVHHDPSSAAASVVQEQPGIICEAFVPAESDRIVLHAKEVAAWMSLTARLRVALCVAWV